MISFGIVTAVFKSHNAIASVETYFRDDCETLEVTAKCNSRYYEISYDCDREFGSWKQELRGVIYNANNDVIYVPRQKLIDRERGYIEGYFCRANKVPSKRVNYCTENGWNSYD